MGYTSAILSKNMIYLFTGSDNNSIRTHAFSWIAAAKGKEPQLTYVHLMPNELSNENFEFIIGAGSLFVNRLLVLLDDPYSTTESTSDTREALTARIDALVATNNAIVIIAPKRVGFPPDTISTKARKVYIFDTKKNEQIHRVFNNTLVNALALRNTSVLWLEIIRAIRAGDTPEMIHGLLHWKARELMKKGSRMWTPTQACSLSLTLLSVLGNSRRTGSDLSLDIERFALSIRDT